MMGRVLGVKGRLAALILLIFIPLVVLRAMEILQQRQQLLDKELLDTAEFARATAESFLAYVQQMWDLQYTMGTAIVAVQDSWSPQQIEQQLLDKVPIPVGVTGFGWATPSGAIIASTQRFYGSVADRDYFRQILQGSDTAVSDLLEAGLIRGRPTIGIARAIRRNGQLVGVVVAGVDPTRIGATLPGLPAHLAPKMAYGLADRRGWVVYLNTDPKLPLDERSLPVDVDRPEREALRGRPSSMRRFVATAQGDIRTGSAHPVEGIGWAAFAHRSEAAVLAPVISETVRHSLVLALVATLSLIGAGLAGNSVLRPIMALQQAAMAIAAGDRRTRIHWRGQDEIAAAVQTFDLMADQIEAAESRLRSHAARQSGIRTLGVAGLEGQPLPLLMEAAADLVASSLPPGCCGIFQHRPDSGDLLLVAGRGWHDGLIGKATVRAGAGSMAGYAFGGGLPVLVAALVREDRFETDSLLSEHGVQSGAAVLIHGEEGPTGVLAAFRRTEGPWSKEDDDFLQSVAHVLSAAIQRHRADEKMQGLLENERAARAEAQAAQNRLSLLSSASALLSSSLDWQTTLENFSRLAVPHLGNLCRIVVVDPDGSVRQVTFAGSPPVTDEWIREFERQFPFDPDASSGAARVLRTGRSEFYPELTPDVILEHTQRGDLARLLWDGGLRSTIIVPMIARGENLGAVTFGRAGGSPAFTNEDLTLCEELASRAALAISNARLYGNVEEAERRYRDLVNSLDAIVWEANPYTFQFSFVSQRAEEILGYPLEEWRERPGFFAQMLHDEDRDWVIQFCRRSTAEGKEHEFQYRALTADGRVVWLNDRVRVELDDRGVPAKLRGVMVDITPLKQTESELRNAQERVLLAMENGRIAFWDWDMVTDRPYLSPNGYGIHGLSPEKWPGNLEGYLLFVDPNDRQEVRTAFRSTLRTPEGYGVEYRFCPPGSPERWLFAKGRAVRNGSGQAVRLVGIVMDVTERRRAEEAVRQLNAELEARVEARTAELTTANAELESFSYSVSHDLRQPLRTIDGFSMALLEDYGKDLDQEARSHLGRIRLAAQRMGQLINSLLTLSRVTRSEIIRETVNLSHLAWGIVAELRARNPDRAAEVHIADGLIVTGDERLLRIALENLFDNAWKFSAHTPLAQMEFAATKQDGLHVFFLRDNGAGFDMAYHDQLFKAFRRLHRASEYEGLGIGLATVERIVKRHGGEIWAESELKKGSTFFFTVGQKPEGRP